MVYLSLIGAAIDDVRRRLSNAEYDCFLSDRDEQALAAFRLSIIGENANKLPAEVKVRHSKIP